MQTTLKKKAIMWLCKKSPTWYRKAWCLITGNYKVLPKGTVITMQERK